jgi:hypothetical protein
MRVGRQRRLFVPRTPPGGQTSHQHDTQRTQHTLSLPKRAGRKGRVIKDDPKKYPGKEDLGVFSGATGGWAGGEAGLWKLREQVLAEKSDKAAPSVPAPATPLPQTKAEAPIYLGFGKQDLDMRKAGAPGRYIVDDPTKYPTKESIGFFCESLRTVLLGMGGS